MTRLRHEIMEDFDTFEGGKRIPEPSLGREDLEHWMKGGNYLSVTKFQYVDRWIRTKRNDPEIAHVFSDLNDLTEADHRRVFTQLYAREPGIYDEIYGHEIDDLEGRLYLSEILQAPEAASAERYSRYVALSDYRQVAIYFRSIGNRSASITVAYLDTPASALRPNPPNKNWAVCFGYLVFVGYDGNRSLFSATLHLFQNAFPGYQHAGSSTSMMSIYAGEDLLVTEWFPQICSQNLTGQHKLDRPQSLPKREERNELEGICRFKDSDGKYEEIREHLSNLTNRYLLW